jgi:hypothetical protein
VEIHKGDILAHVKGAQVPFFSGQATDLSWPVWWSKFYETVHRYAPHRLSESKKFDALRNLVTDDARLIVNPWYNTALPGNYKEAIASLHTEYGDLERQRLSVAQALREEKPAGQKMSDFKEFFRNIQSWKLMLQACGESKESAADAAYNQLKTFAPAGSFREFRNELNRAGVNMSSDQKFEKYLSYLNSNIDTYTVTALAELEKAPVPSKDTLTREEQFRRMREADHSVFPALAAAAPASTSAAKPAGKPQPAPQPQQQKRPWNNNNGRGRGQTKGFNGRNQNNRGFKKRTFKPQWQCPFCETNDHHYFACLKTIQQRIQALIDKKKCLNCARTGHVHEHCRSWTCRNCKYYGKNSYHHSGLCKYEEHPEHTKFKLQRLKDFQTRPKVMAQFVDEFAAALDTPKALGGQAGGEEPKRARMQVTGCHYGSAAYIASAYVLYPITGDESESEEDAASDSEVEELEPQIN